MKEVETLLVQAQAFALQAEEALGKEVVLNPESRQRLVIHFIFPHLSEEERALLAAVEPLRRHINRLLRVGGPAGRWNGEAERALTSAEIQLVKLRQVISEAGVVDKLTLVQRIVLEQELFRIEFAE